MNSLEIKIYKLDRKISGSSSQESKEGESLSFTLIEEIKIEDIITLITKKAMKNIINIQFNSNKFGRSSIIIDFITDVDTKSFIKKTKELIERYNKNNEVNMDK